MNKGLYKIINLKTNKYYVGRTKDTMKRFLRHKKDLMKNIHHCIYLQRAWNLYGAENFEFILEEVILNDKELRDREQYYLDNFSECLYNTSRNSGGGDLISYHPRKKEIVKKISDTLKHKNSKLSIQERSQKFGSPGELNGMFGKQHSKDAITKMSNAASIRVGEKNSFYGKTHSDDTKKSLSEYAKQRTGEKNPFYGRKHTEETKKKISQVHKGKIPTNIRAVVIDNIEYKSLGEASKALNVVPATISHRIKSKNLKFTNYFYKDSID